VLNGKLSSWLSNGGTEILWKLLPIAFATGVLWMKVGSVQSSVDTLTVRVAAVEGVLMGTKR